ncbi:YbjQ family protein [Salinispirillum sp. LH 10-3-1]|uniref:YbjQ family protein n=1 Tax=Salinispirillum sp. LH 10-3-1 TaxID=2952525 RepID=A0AB38YE20_9GAMM
MLLTVILPLLAPLALLITGYVVGGYLERRHFERLALGEAEQDLPTAIALRHCPEQMQYCGLVMGSVVISHDYFKRFLAIIRMLFGGRLRSYETLLERARREALLRLREQARALGATHVYNLKFETATISGRGRQAGIGSLEVFVYGTAVRT